MDVFDAIKVCLKKYVTFSGRARRAEYWYFTLAVIILYFLLHFVGESAPFTTRHQDGTKETMSELFSTTFMLLVFLPSIAVACRRLHDINKRGWWQLIGIIPVLGPLAMLFFCAQIGTSGPNRFGEDPLVQTI